VGFAIASMIVRRAADSGLATFAITLYVGLVRFIICALIVLARGNVRERALCIAEGWEFLALCTLRQALGVVSIVGAFGAFSRIPIGDATVLLFTSPVWTTAMARVWLGEPTTRTGQVRAGLINRARAATAS
jgi:drug/metabolite transporter (DMT)-like permease